MKYFVVILLAFLIFSTFIPVAFTQLQNQREEDRKEREEEDEEKRQNELVVEVARQTNLSVPLVVRLAGTNVELGKEILQKSNLKIISANNLSDAATKIIEATK